jgi:transcriptional regulator with XRE-family HTH domain
MILVNERIEFIRKKKGVSKASLARAMGVSPMTYHYLANGRTPITTVRLEIISKELGVSPIIFLSNELTELFSDEITTISS